MPRREVREYDVRPAVQVSAATPRIIGEHIDPVVLPHPGLVVDQHAYGVVPSRELAQDAVECDLGAATLFWRVARRMGEDAE
jgi:hypothetical protein